MSADKTQWIREIAAEGRRWHKVHRESDAAAVVAALDFEQVIRASYQMLYNERGMTSVREFAVQVLNALREAAPERWNADWRHEALLALIAERAMEMEARNEAWGRAFNLIAPEMTTEFAFLLARTTYDLETAPVNLDEAIRMLEAGMEKRPAADGAARLALLYKDKGDADKERQWLAREKELRAAGAELLPLLPPPLEDEHYLGPKAKARRARESAGK